MSTITELSADLPAEMTLAELAQLFDCHPRTVGNLAQRGVAVRLRHGKYDPAKSARNYIQYLRGLADQRGTNDPRAVKANAEFKQARTALLEQRIRREAAALIDRDELVRAWAAIKAGTEHMINGLPAKISMAVDLTEHDQRVVRQLISDNLTDLALDRGFSVCEGGSAGRLLADDEDDPPPAA